VPPADKNGLAKACLAKLIIVTSLFDNCVRLALAKAQGTHPLRRSPRANLSPRVCFSRTHTLLRVWSSRIVIAARVLARDLSKDRHRA
jgi:hypothetical protein